MAVTRTEIVPRHEWDHLKNPSDVQQLELLNLGLSSTFPAVLSSAGPDGMKKVDAEILGALSAFTTLRDSVKQTYDDIRQYSEGRAAGRDLHCDHPEGRRLQQSGGGRVRLRTEFTWATDGAGLRFV